MQYKKLIMVIVFCFFSKIYSGDIYEYCSDSGEFENFYSKIVYDDFSDRHLYISTNLICDMNGIDYHSIAINLNNISQDTSNEQNENLNNMIAFIINDDLYDHFLILMDRVHRKLNNDLIIIRKSIVENFVVECKQKLKNMFIAKFKSIDCN